MVVIKIGKLWAFLFPFLSAYLTFCQVDFKAYADYQSIPLNGKVTITYVLKKGNVESFQRPDFSTFRIISQQSITGTGGMTIIINNQVVNNDQGESKWIFVLVPTQVGTFTIPPARIKVNGKWYESNALTIQVTSKGAPSKGTTPPPSTTYASSNQQSSSRSSQSSMHSDIFLRLVANKNSAYVGEQIIVSLLMYTLYDVEEYTLDKLPVVPNAWSEELLNPKSSVKTWNETIGNKTYLVGEIRKIAIFPQTAGKLVIPFTELEAVIKIYDQKQYDPFSLFDQFFKDPFNFNFDPFSSFKNFRLEKIKLQSNTLSLDILPLPSKGKPTNFNGAVGQFTAEASLDNNVIKSGDVGTLKITIRGKGNLPLIQYSPFDQDDSIQVFEPDISLDLNKTSSGVEGIKTFTYLFQPNFSGKTTLHLNPFYYFDPVRKQYDSITFQALPLTIIQGPADQQVLAEKKFQEDIRGISEPIKLFMFSKQFAFSWAYWGIHGLVLLIVAATLFIYRKRIALMQNVADYRMRQAQKLARKRLKMAEKWMLANRENEFLDTIAETLWMFILEKFKMPMMELNRDTARKTLIDHQIPIPIVDNFMQLLEEVDFFRFAPVSQKPKMRDIYDKASNLIVKIIFNRRYE
ncbi:MAG: BatD family protein [Bacteroidales bacterium]|nr:BatD family protein [Bacteroidales bacterium]